MKLKRKGKVSRVNPVDFGLEELSKINKDNEVRFMDRSRERTGDKISLEEGLYVPKREPYEMIKITASDSDLPKRKRMSDLEREDYSFGKTYAVGEQYLDNENYNYYDYSEHFSYDDLDDNEDFSLDEFFDESYSNSIDVYVEPDVKEAYSSRNEIKDEEENITQENEFEDENGTKTTVNNNEYQEILKAIDYSTRHFAEAVSEEKGSDEQTNDEQTSAETEAEEAEKVYDEKPVKKGYTFLSANEAADMFERTYLGMDQASNLRTLKQKYENAEEVQQKEVQQNAEEEALQIETQQYKVQQNKIKNDEIKEEQLRAVKENIERAANAKEKLALEREAVRLGMAEALLEADGSDMVRPELLEEIGFTPGGEKEPEIVKNKRFKFGKKNKNNQNESKRAENKQTENSQRENVKPVAKSSIAEKKVDSDINARTSSKRASTARNRNNSSQKRERRSEIMHDENKRKAYIIKNKKRLSKAKEDFEKMQEKYDSLTQCLNDMILMNSLPEDTDKNLKNTAGMIVKYRHEVDKTKSGIEMDTAIYRKMEQNKDEVPSVIKRLAENEKYADKLQNEISEIERQKSECQNVSEENVNRQRKTKNISIAVIVVTILTMIFLIVLQFALESDMQIPILIFGACVILETLGIFVQHFKTETDETTNHYKLNKLIKKQNMIKVKFVNAKNAVDFVYEKYNVNSSSELLFQWEAYQRTFQAREEFKIAGNEVIYYEDRLFVLLKEYGFNNPDVWVTNAEYLVEENQLSNVKAQMSKKREKLMIRMEKCKKVIDKLDNELSVLVIKFPQYADEIKKLLI